MHFTDCLYTLLFICTYNCTIAREDEALKSSSSKPQLTRLMPFSNYLFILYSARGASKACYKSLVLSLQQGSLSCSKQKCLHAWKVRGPRTWNLRMDQPPFCFYIPHVSYTKLAVRITRRLH